MNERIIRWVRRFAIAIERLLALAILVGVVTFAVASAAALVAMDWHGTDAFYELIYRVLLTVIGVELIRTLVTHDLMAVLELLAFVIARKMLKPDLPALDILLGVAAFVGLLGARRLLVAPPAARPAAGSDVEEG